MSLQAVYKQFLAAPNSSLLAADATLHYITTTTTFNGANDIIKHVNTSRNQVKKKKEEFLQVIEGHNAIAVEVDTVLEFVTSGGAYLPGLDDNFLSDRTVYQLVTHMVTFDADGKILQIRQTWDQAALLKQLDVIGKTGRNWPIRDSKEQIRLLVAALKTVSGNVPAGPESDFATRSRGSSKTILRDPHASLALFAPREEADQAVASVISPRAGARPRQRSFNELIGDEPAEEVGSPSAGRDRSQSPSKAVAPKAGSGKNYHPSRLFATDDIPEETTPDKSQSPDRFYRPNPQKYNHFDFADGSEPQDAPDRGDPNPDKTKHSSQWSFDDFVTPHKAKPTRVLQKAHQAVRHWGNEEDDVQESPIRKPQQVKPRRDAETHFEFKDDGAPQGEPRAARPRGTSHNTGLGLYKNNVYSEEADPEAAVAAENQALGNITNTSLADRKKDFDPHFSMTDDSPAQKPQPKAAISDDRKKAVKMMDPNWSSYDTSPAQKENKPNAPAAAGSADGRGIAIGGDGMGGSKGTNRNWLFGDDDEVLTKAVPGRKQGGAAAGGFNWDF